MGTKGCANLMHIYAIGFRLREVHTQFISQYHYIFHLSPSHRIHCIPMDTTKNCTGEELSPSGLPIKPIPGSCGVPFFSPMWDRLNFYYFQGHMTYFKSRISKHNSTVLRLNVPPGPFLSSDPRVVAVLDASSFQVLLDSSKVDKTNTLTGTYLPPFSLYSGHRPLAYLDTTDPLHTSLKTLITSLITSRKDHVIPSFREIYGSLFDNIYNILDSSGPTEFNTLNESASFDFMCSAFFEGELPSVAIGPTASAMALKWLFFQLHPLKYFTNAGKSFLTGAEQIGISHNVALHNLIFATIFNAFGGIKIFLPFLLKFLVEAGPKLHNKLSEEIRSVVQSENGSVTLASLEKMNLTKSVVYEALRLNPPVEYQYGHARADLIIESHDAAYKVKKGEMIFGYQTIVTRDEKVFANGEQFVADRFVGEGEKLLQYVYWSNGRETDEPAITNKQCPGKDIVVLVGRLFVVELFLRYDTFTGEIGELPLEPKITFKSFQKLKQLDALTV
ncbi:allene oxide synthase 2-like protein [Carex littledalei]|uniref:Allene oxide synthase 2-like protein n=1 Tax=Carex littledalei TaxID=544730 RepID=A0A833VTN0_9POAL|nr:allene oxide synthase 2-like protein [Carex littledalei]